MLTLRLKQREVDVLRDELHHRRAAITEAAAAAHAASTVPEAGAGDPDVERRHDELLLISRLLDELHTPAPLGQSREIVGPTWLLAPVIRGAAGEAVARLVAAVDQFREDRGMPSSDQLRVAVDTARAWTATLIGLDHAENHAVA